MASPLLSTARRRLIVLALLCLNCARAPWSTDSQSKRLVLDVTFETSKDYDITSAYAVRGWNTTEGHMKINCPSQIASHGGRFGMEVNVDRPYTKNFHAQFSLPHFMPRVAHSAYQLTFWAKVLSGKDVTPEVSFLDVDEGYDWVGGAEVALTNEWQHIAMEPVYTTADQKGHEIQIAFLIGLNQAVFHFDDIQLYELDVPSPPPPSPPPPPYYLMWLDAEGGPKGAQTVVKAGAAGELTADLSSTAAAHEGTYGFEVSVAKTFDEDYYGMLSLPAFLVTDHERLCAAPPPAAARRRPPPPAARARRAPGPSPHPPPLPPPASYTLSFWAKATGNPKPRPHVTFQDEDADYAWIDGEYVQVREAAAASTSTPSRSPPTRL